MFSTTEEWQSLRELQRHFLVDSEAASKRPSGDYWRDAQLLDRYDLSFAQRIAWKWEAVLAEHKADFQGISWLKDARVVDYGCGSGVASRSWLAFLGEFLEGLELKFDLCDRSLKARQFAAKKLREQPGGFVKEIREVVQEDPLDAVILSSHILNELEPRHVQHQGRVWGKSRMVIALEAGTPAGSKALRELRKVMMDTHEVIGPCLHQSACPLDVDVKRAKDWCHFFVKAPAFVFQDAGWRAFSEELKVDLRRQPVSYMILVRKDLWGQSRDCPHASKGRVLGVVKEDKGGMEALLCQSDGEMHARKYSRREHKDFIKAVMKSPPWIVSV